MLIGLLGKANVGKSTFFSAATETIAQSGNFPFTTIEPNVGVAHVKVDCMTGEVRLVDLLLVEDVGRIVNPLTLQGQAIGAMVQGLGGAFLEQIIYDENGQLVTGTLADYLLPQASSFPNIRAIMLEDSPSPINPLGIKGGGEGGILPMGGLMANAVASALKKYDVKPNALPLSPPNIMSLISAKYGKEI